MWKALKQKLFDFSLFLDNFSYNCQAYFIYKMFYFYSFFISEIKIFILTVISLRHLKCRRLQDFCYRAVAKNLHSMSFTILIDFFQQKLLNRGENPLPSQQIKLRFEFKIKQTCK